MLKLNKKLFVSIFVTILIVLGTSFTSFGQAEARTVKLFYFLPNDRPYRQHVVDNMKTGILSVQSFYADQMEAHGYGRKTFNIETDGNGNPVVHRVNGDRPASRYDTNGRSLNEINRAFDTSSIVQLVVMDMSGGGIGGRGTGIKQRGLAIIYGGWNWGHAAHELGHAFGLHHDFRDDSYVMSYGTHSSLSAGAAHFLSVNPYFNSSVPLQARAAPSVQLLSPTTYWWGVATHIAGEPFTPPHVPVQLRVRDPDGIQQVTLFVVTPDKQTLNRPPGYPEVIEYRNLSGQTDVTVTFDYEGNTPSFGDTDIFNTLKHTIYVSAIDSQGNRIDHMPSWTLRATNVPEPQVPLRERSPRVAEAIYNVVRLFHDRSVTGHNQILRPHLGMITTMFVNDIRASDSALQANDFDGLTSLNSLELRIESGYSDSTLLPAGIFKGLTSLDSVKIRWYTDTYGSDLDSLPRLPFTIGLEKVGESQFKVIMPMGAPSEMEVPLIVVNGNINGGAESVTIPAGSVESDVLTVTRTPGTTAAVVVDLERVPPNPPSYFASYKSSYHLEMISALAGAPSPVTERTPQVLDAIVGVVPEIEHIHHDRDHRYMINGSFVDKKYNMGHYVTEAQLTAITSLDISGGTNLDLGGNWFSLQGDITELKSGDFDGLPNLTSLRLDGNELSSLPVGLFDNLTELTTLSLNGNQLSSLPAGIFDNLTNLETLNLSSNDLSSLPVGLFDNLTNLTFLNLLDNPLTSLPEGYFDNLPNLETLHLPRTATPPTTPEDSEITSVADRTQQVRDAIVAAIDGVDSAADVTAAHLAAITELNLLESELTELKSGDLDNLINLHDLGIGGTFSLLPAGIFDDLTNLTGLLISSTQLSLLPAGIFDNLTNLTSLAISSTQLSSLPAGIFDNLTNLNRIGIVDTQLSSLPTGIFDNFTNVPMIILSNNQLSSLPQGIFDKATMILDLSNNQLRSLPNGIFEGIFDEPPDLTGWDIFGIALGQVTADRLDELGEYTTLNLTGNAVDPLPLTVSLERVGHGQFKAVAPTGAPFELVLPIRVVNGTITGGATSATIPVGSVESEVFTVTRTSSSTWATRVYIGTLPQLWSQHTGYSLVKSDDLPIAFPELGGRILTPVHQRSPQVRDFIVQAIPGVSDPRNVTEAHLAAITNIVFELTNPVKEGDFDGLTGATRVILRTILTSIPVDFLNEFSNLTFLEWEDYQLSSLPIGVFDNLTNLTDLRLIFYELSSLPDGIFDNLTNLTTLYLESSQLSSLPDGIFDNLTNLTDLDFSAGQLSSLPDGIFDHLTNLTTLRLSGDQLNSLPSSILDQLTNLTTLRLSGDQLNSLPSSILDQLTNLTTFTLLSTQLLTLPDGLLSGLSSLTSLNFFRNAADPMPFTVSLEKVGTDQFKAVAPTGAPFNIVLSITVTNGSINDAPSSTITIPTGSVESETLTVKRFSGTTAAVTVDIGTLPGLPSGHEGYTLAESDDLLLEFTTGLAVGIFPVSERTPQVRDAIVAAVPGVNNAADVTEAHLSAITTLYLEDKNITSLKSGDFQGLTSLEELRLYDNQLTSLPEDIFSGLTALTTLTLYDNQLSTLPPGIFNGLSSLATLQFGVNQLTTLPPGIFNGLSSLSTLRFGSNQLTTLPAGLFDGLTSLTDLRMVGNQLTTLPDGIFEDLTALTRLYLSGNPISDYGPLRRLVAAIEAAGRSLDLDITIPSILAGRTSQVRDAIVAAVPGVNSADDVTEAHLAGIVRLTISGGNVTELKEGDFDGLTALDYLYLTNNRLTALPKGVFSDLSSLTSLSIGSNQFNSLETGVFKGLSSLISLELQSNQFTTFDANIFSDLPALKYLNLYGNQFTTLDGDTFSQLSSLEELSLHGNQISSLVAGDLSGLPPLKSLRLDGNRLTSLPAKVFNSLPSLTSLLLHENQLTSIDAETFSGLTSLNSITLYRNQITSIANGAFSELSSLKVLNLHENRLTSIPEGLFSGLSLLTTVYIHKNPVDPLPLTVTLEKVVDGQFKAVVSTGAPFKMVVPISVTDGSINGGATTLTIPAGSMESEVLTVTRTPGATYATTVNIGTLRSQPGNHIGYSLVKSGNLPLAFPELGGQVFTSVGSRTPQVAEAILGVVRLNDSNVSNFAEITNSHLTGVNALYLNGRNITSLKSGDFEGLSSLEELRLYDNQLTSLPEGIFSGLTALTTLTLYRNQLSTLPPRIFNGLSSLATLQFGVNQLSTLPPGIFNGLSSLATLRFGSNQLTTLPAGLFDGLTSLTDLRMIDNQLTTLPDDIFEDLTALTRLYLSGNPISDYGPLRRLVAAIEAAGRSLDLDITIPSLLGGRTPEVRDAIVAAVPGVNSTNHVTEEHLAAITTLNLRGKGLTALKTGDFSGLTSLTNLNLRHNNIASLPSGIFDELISLTELNLDGNNLTSLRSGVFDNNTALTELYLYSNEFRSFPQGIFDQLTALTTLDCSFNDLASLRSGVFDNNTALTILELDDNVLTSLPAGIFDNLTSLTNLELSDNTLTTLPSGIFDNLTSLTNLYLSDTSISNISDLDGLTSLTFLTLYNNSISDISALEDLTSLTFLRLDNNSISDISALEDLTSLTDLYLYNNSISDISALEGLTALTTLDLTGNQLTTLPDGIFEGLTGLRRLRLGSNAVAPLSLTVTLEQVGTDQFKAVAPTGAPFDIVVPLSVTDGSISGGATTLTIPAGSLESDVLTVTRTPGATYTTAVNIGTLSSLPANHTGYSLVKSADLPLVFPELGGQVFTSVGSRTPQVAEAILGVVRLNDPNVSSYAEITNSHLTGITTLYLNGRNITSLKSGDFAGLTALEELRLYGNQISSLPEDIFEGLSALRTLNLYNNQLSSLPDGLFEGLTSLTTLRLNGNAVTPIPLTVSLEKVGTDQFKAVAPTGAPFDIVLPLSVANGSISGGATSLTIPAGSVESDVLTVTRTPSVTFAVSADIGTLPGVPNNHTGYTLVKSADLPIEVISEVIPIVLVDKGVCKVGDILALGESCTYPGTDAVFSVIADGRSQWNIPGLPDWLAAVVNRISTNDSMSVTSTVNGKTYRFEARTVENDSWQIEQIGDRTQESIALGINIPDSNLRSKIEAALSKSTGDTITVTEMETLTSLNGQNSSISDLTGLETATNLTTLELGNNAIADISALANLTKLTELQLWDNQISNLSNISGLTNLTKLYLWGNSISDISHLSGLTNLTHLRLGENNISNISTVSNLTNLTQLNLNENTITDISAVAGLTYLTELIIGSNTISDITPVQNLTNLEWFDIPNNSISDISAVQNLTALVELYFQNNSVSDVSPLVGNTGLGEFTEIDMRGNPLNYQSIYTHIPALQAKDVYIDFDNRVATTPVKISGDTQSGETGATLTQPFIVEVKDSGSVIFAGVPVTFAVTAGGGTLSATNTTTDVNGRAQTTLTLGDTAGTNTVSISVPGVTQTITFTATATAPVVISIIPVGDRTSQVAQVILGVVRLDYPNVSTYAEITATHIASPTVLYLNNKNITTLKSGDFDGLTGLEDLRLNNNQLTSLPSDIFSGLTSLSNLNLFNNQLSSLPDGIFEGLTSLTKIRLGRNTVDPLPVTVSLEKVAEGQFKAVVPTGAPFTIVLPISIANGSITGGASSVTIQQGSLESDTLNVTRTGGTTADVTVDIVTLPSLPPNHFGYALVKPDDLPLAVITRINTAPVFTDGTAITRTVAENVVAATNIGTPIAATDTENDTLTYTLSGDPDASAFDIDSTTGQLKTKTSLDYETKSTYTVTITVSDGSLTDTITVTINVTDIDEVVPVDPVPTNTAPVFTEGGSTIRSVAENTAPNVNIGTPIIATDADNETLTYSLGGTDATSFSIDTATGQIKTLVALDYETKSSYTIIITVSDANEGTDSITVTINITDVNEQQTSTTTYNVGDDITTLPSGFWTPDRTANGASFSFVGGQVTITFNNNGLIGKDDITYTCIAVGGCEIVNGQVTQGTIEATTDDAVITTPPPPVTNRAPVFSEGTSATRFISENTASAQNIGTAIAATDAEGHTLTYTLSGADASAFDIDNGTGQLKTKATLDYETKNTYTVTITVSDGSLTDTITVTINITDIDESVVVVPPTTNVAPTFTDGESTTRVVLENTAADTNIGNPVNATDANNDTLTYSLGGIDAASFDIDSTTGQLKTEASLDYESKRVYSVTITAADDELSDTITVIISVIDVNDTVLSSGFVPVADRTSQVRDAIVAAVPNVTDAADVTESQVAAITSLNLRSKGISSLKIGDFSGMSSLSSLNLFRNQLSSLPTGMFTGLTALQTLRLGGNAIDPMPLIVTLQSTGSGEHKAVIVTGAPFNIVVPINVSNGSISGGTTSVTISQGSMESASFTVSGASPQVSFGTFPGLPQGHFGYTLAQSDVCNRTTEVADAIAAAVSVSDCSDVTETDLATITRLDLSGSAITSLQTGDFDGMFSLRTLYLENNDLTSLPNGIFDDLVSLTFLSLNENKLTTLPSGVFSKLSSLTHLDLFDNDISSLPSGVFSGLSALTSLSLKDNELTNLPSNIFNGLSSVTSLSVSNNKLTSLPAGIFNGLVSVNQLQLNGNPADPLPLVISLQKVGTNQFKAVALSGTPFALVLPITITNGTVTGGATTMTIPIGTVESQPLTITRTAGTVAAVTADIGTALPRLPSNHNGYNLLKSRTLPLEVLPPLNSPPVFTEGASTTRTISENTVIGTNIGDAITATDVNTADTLTYTLRGTDAAAFDIDSTTGQLTTKVALDYETKNTYSVTLTVSDSIATDTIGVTINILNVNEAPEFAAGSLTTHTVAENTVAGTNIGTAYSATDVDGDTLTYSLSGQDAAAFGIDTETGQLKTSAALDYETKTIYSVTIVVSDTGLTDTITVTINITDVDENAAPVFAEGNTATRSIAENTATDANIGTAVSATDADNDTLTYTLGGTDTTSFDIDSTTGQLKTKNDLDYETKNSYTVTISVSDGKTTDTITVTINITDIDESVPNRAPVFTAGTTTTRSIAENTAAGTNIGTSVSATDVDGNTLIYKLGGTDAASFDIDNSTGQLKTKVALDYETKSSYTFTITVSDGSLTDTITVTINVTDVEETIVVLDTVSTPQDQESEAQQDNTLIPDENLLTAVRSALELDDDDVLTTTLIGTLTSLATRHEAISDLTGLEYATSLTSLSLEFSQISDISPLQDLTQLTSLNLSFGLISDITSLQKLTNLTSLSLHGSNNNENRISDITPLGNLTKLTSLDLRNNQISNISTLSSLTELVRLRLTQNQISDVSALQNLVKLRTLALYGNSISDYAPLRTLKAQNPFVDVDIIIPAVTQTTNNAPEFTAGDRTTRSIAENTAAGVNIGTAVSATDDDNDTLTYNIVLDNTDASAFDIDSNTGQLKTKASLDYETKSSYQFRVFVSDGNGGHDSISVTVNITDVVEDSPISSRTTQVRDAIVAAIRNVDSHNNVTLAHLARIQSLRITNKSIASLKSGDFANLTSLNWLELGGNDFTTLDEDIFEDLTALTHISFFAASLTSLPEDIFDGPSSLESIDLRSNDLSSLPSDIFDGLSSLESLGLARNDLSSLPSDVFNGLSSLDSLDLGGNDLSSLPSGIFDDLSSLETLDLRNNSITDVSELEDLTSLTTLYLAGNSITDYAPLRALKQSNTGLSIDITIPGVVNNVPEFTDGETATRTINEAYPVDRKFGDALSVTDADNDALTFTATGTDTDTFGVVRSSDDHQGLLYVKASAQLDYDTKSSYTITVTVSDGKGGSDSITVTINLTQAPEFDDGTSTTRSIAEGTAANVNIGDPISATDAEGDTLTYSLVSGDHPNTFDIDKSTGQLKTRAFLDYETTASYTIKVRVYDSDGGGGSTDITVTINVIDVDENLVQVSDRTEAVRDALVSATRKVASEITAEDLARISRLDLSREGITSLKSGDFSGLVALTWLDLSINSISTLPSDVFDGLTSLTTLRIDSDLTSYPADVFDDLSSLTELRLNDYTATSIPEDLFESLTSLTDFTVRFGAATSIPEDLFDELTSLTSLSLSGSSLTSLHEDLFDELTSLTSLSLSSMGLTSLHEDQFDGLSSLETFSLGSLTSLSSLPGDLFDGLSSLTSIYFSFNQISFPTDLFDGLSSLTSIEFSQCIGLSSVPEDLIDGLTSLTSFSLTGSGSISLPEDLFDGLTSLTSINLSWNTISSIPEDLFDGLSSLTSIDIAGISYADNDLTSVPSDLFDGLSSLSSINLRNHELTSLPSDLFDGLSSLSSVSVSGNPLTDYTPLQTLKDNDSSISIDINLDNNFPVFTDGESTTRTYERNTINNAENENVGTPITATDADDDTLTYKLSGTDSNKFSINRSTGQLTTSSHAFNYSINTTYSVTVMAYDGNSGADFIDVSISVTQAGNGAPSAETTPIQTELLANFPNPFNPETWIPYELSKSADVTLTIYNMRGVVVRQLKLGQKPAGVYLSRSRAIHWDGRNSIGEKVAAGVYFYTLEAGNFSATRKMLIRK